MSRNEHEHRHHHHHDSTSHTHSHSDPSHRPAQKSRLLWVLSITAAMMIVEAVGGVLTGSLALISDAGHMLTHFFALAVSLVAILVAARPASPSRSYGYYRAEVLAALLNGVTLIGLSAYIFYEAYQRFLHPEQIMGREMLIIAVAGLIVNVVSALMLHGVTGDDLNVRSAFFHLLGDTVSSVVIIIGAAVIWLTGWVIIDPILSVLVCALILIWSWRLLSEAVHILMEAAPPSLQIDEVRRTIQEGCGGNCDIHDLHLWVITSGMPALSAHVLVEEMSLQESGKLSQKVRALLQERHGIKHAVLQFECECSDSEGHHGHSCCLHG